MLFDLESVAAVAPEALQALGPDAVWLQMRTVGLAGSEQLAALAKEHAVGSKTVWVDAPSGGTRLKLVANTWVLALTEGVAESIALAEGLGLDPQLFLDTIKGGPKMPPMPGSRGAR